MIIYTGLSPFGNDVMYQGVAVVLLSQSGSKLLFYSLLATVNVLETVLLSFRQSFS